MRMILLLLVVVVVLLLMLISKLSNQRQASRKIFEFKLVLLPQWRRVRHLVSLHQLPLELADEKEVGSWTSLAAAGQNVGQLARQVLVGGHGPRLHRRRCHHLLLDRKCRGGPEEGRRSSTAAASSSSPSPSPSDGPQPLHVGAQVVCVVSGRLPVLVVSEGRQDGLTRPEPGDGHRRQQQEVTVSRRVVRARGFTPRQRLLRRHRLPLC